MKLWYAGINTNLEYVFARRFSIIGGVGYNQLLSSSFRNESSLTSTSRSNNYNVSFALAYTSQVSQQWDIKIQPTFNYYLKESVKSEFNVKPYNWGLRLNFIRK